MFPFWLPPPILGYLIVFSAGCIFTLLALGVTLILFVRYSSTSTLKGTSPKHIGPVTSKPRLSQTHAKTHKSLELDNDGEYDPDLGKVGWIRFSSEPLTIDQLYMDSSGNDTIYFLGGIGSDKKTSGGEAFAGTEVVAANHRTYLNSFSFVWKFAIYVGDAALQTSNYLVSRFTGEDLAPLPEIANESTKHREPFIAPWRDVFAVLKNDSLFLYSSDEKMTCLDVIQLSECEVSLNAPNVPDHEIYQRHLPLSLNLCEHLGSEAPRPVHLLYSLTNSDKEDWYLLLRRASLSNYSIHNNISPTSVASTAISISQIQENYICSMKKLTSSIAIDDPTSAWINAFLGRIFVGFHSNPRIKAYLIQKLSRRGTKSFDTGFLSDIVISDLNIGDSLPILSSPRLVSFSLDGDLILDLNLNYTGGIRVEAATVATISVSTLNLQPFSIPLVLAIKINHIHATIRLKIKPFHESSRVWVGLHPNLDIGIQVDPVISNRLITLNMVNQVIEKRVKDALNEFIVLPNMDDFGFWPGGGKGGFFWDGADETVEVETTVSDGGDKLPEPTSSTISDPVRASEGTQERDKKAANETPELFSTERLNPNATVPVGFLPALPEKPKVLTGGIVIDEPATDSDDAILYAAFKQQAQSMKLSVVGGPLEATIQQPSASQRSN
ncbi:hypothetical protein BCR33DRAFT_309505 [Rhizoclosmatium globosum]|uniref:SMP-LTD domain-containing protein n=1 Tax=Rhizoclosmatium globosum TaxID=329046 RepID=A0A1Y2C5T1_9FUNG|nr:hypothetical protein BCR33DRAFT_309505 [Rhizoclosmatium globosum]|eukprot:ORY42393.1 hypothetical protein BCR33DRAFT_309505 [Rhizoclosmatium globosum]